MDQLTRGTSAAARVRAAATEAGVTPNDPLNALVQALADIPEEIANDNTLIRAEMRELTKQNRMLIETAEKAAKKPLMNSQQIKYDLLPAIVAAITGFQVLVGIVLLTAAFCGGVAAHKWWLEPVICDAKYGDQPICYRFDGPAVPKPTPAPKVETPPGPAPASNKQTRK